jgi:CubicO group peptidase (beta-lactamase class C family)
VLADTPPQSPSIAIKLNLETTLEQLRARNKVPALSIGIIENGQIFYQKGFRLTASGETVTAKTKFRVASITKLFTAQAVMQLVEDGKLRLDDSIGKYLRPSMIERFLYSN